MISCKKQYYITVNAGSSFPEPTAYWRLEEASGTRDDAVGTTDNDLIATGPDMANAVGIIGQGMYFNNTPLAIYRTTQGTAINYDTNSDGFTMCFWLKFTGAIGGNHFLAYLSAWDTQFEAEVYSYQVVFTTQNPSGPDSVATITTPIAVGDWHFYACQYQKSTQKSRVSMDAGAWIEAVDTADLAGAVTTPSQFTAGGVLSITGILDEMGIWVGTVLTDDQITDLYNSGAGKTYPF